jgi:hypothetical protein
MKLQLTTLSSLPPTVADGRIARSSFEKHDISLYPVLDQDMCG